MSVLLLGGCRPLSSYRCVWIRFAAAAWVLSICSFQLYWFDYHVCPFALSALPVSSVGFAMCI
jgi:hypothetical protein